MSLAACQTPEQTPAGPAAAGRADVERFRAAIVQRMGLQFEDAKLVFLGEVLHRRLHKLGAAVASYLERLELAPRPDELAALARELTVGETYFFRHNDQFRAVAEVALPERARAGAAAGSNVLRLLSAGCATGEEAYSLAIVAREVIADPSWRIDIRGVDLNPAVLEKALRGRYSPWALREAPQQIRDTWFRAEGRDLVLDKALRDTVQFGAANLAGDEPELWQAAAYDVIFCRNVLMYFAPEQMRAAIARMADALAPGGYLFLGHAETLRGISDEFHLCHSHDTFYYRRKEHGAAPRRTSIPIRAETPVAAALVQAHPTAWIDAIRHASERVAALVAPPDRNVAPALSAAAGWKLAPVFDFLRHERFSEALDYVRSGPPETGSDPDVLLVKAMLLIQAGERAAAEETCQRLLLLDELNAGAHYVLALCREHAGERDRAIEHDRVAAHLDPAFAMPRLHCGLLARHAGDRDTARRELAQALLLLRREDVSRLLLFGGGFHRDALIALAQSAVAECGGRP
jgi:chemotaxis protein methyltransferase CheR